MVSRAAIIKQFVLFPRKAAVGLQVSAASLPVQQVARGAEILAYMNDWLSRKESEGSSAEVCDVTSRDVLRRSVLTSPRS
jgi:hypothetical protein